MRKLEIHRAEGVGSKGGEVGVEEGRSISSDPIRSERGHTKRVSTPVGQVTQTGRARGSRRGFKETRRLVVLKIFIPEPV